VGAQPAVDFPVRNLETFKATPTNCMDLRAGRQSARGVGLTAGAQGNQPPALDSFQASMRSAIAFTDPG